MANSSSPGRHSTLERLNSTGSEISGVTGSSLGSPVSSFSLSRHNSGGDDTLATSVGDDEEDDEEGEEMATDDDDTTTAGGAGDRDSEGSNYAEDPILTILQELDESHYIHAPLTPIPKGVLSTIQLVGKRGILPYSWHLVKRALRVRLRQLCHTCWHSHGYLGPANTSFEQQLESLLGMIDGFEDEGGPPFTIQRVAELACDGTQWYKSTHKLFNAFEKCLRVETTMESVEEDCTLVEHKDSDFYRNSDLEGEDEGGFADSDSDSDEDRDGDGDGDGDTGVKLSGFDADSDSAPSYLHTLNADNNESEIAVMPQEPQRVREEASKGQEEEEDAAMQQQEQQEQQDHSAPPSESVSSSSPPKPNSHRHSDMIALALGMHDEEKERRKRPRVEGGSGGAGQ